MPSNIAQETLRHLLHYRRLALRVVELAPFLRVHAITGRTWLLGLDVLTLLDGRRGEKTTPRPREGRVVRETPRGRQLIQRLSMRPHQLHRSQTSTKPPTPHRASGGVSFCQYIQRIVCKQKGQQRGTSTGSS